MYDLPVSPGRGRPTNNSLRPLPDQRRMRLRGEHCSYCGVVVAADRIDFFPPAATCSWGYALPSCDECKELAGCSHPADFSRRASVVRFRLKRRYAALLDDVRAALLIGQGAGAIQGDDATWLRQHIALKARLSWSLATYMARIDGAGVFDLPGVARALERRERAAEDGDLF